MSPKPKGNGRFNGRRMKLVRGCELWRKDRSLQGWKGYWPMRPGNNFVPKSYPRTTNEKAEKITVEVERRSVVKLTVEQNYKRLDFMQRGGVVSLNLRLSKSRKRLLELMRRGGVSLNLLRLAKSLKRLELMRRDGASSNCWLSNSLKRLELKPIGWLGIVCKLQLSDELMIGIFIVTWLDHRRRL